MVKLEIIRHAPEGSIPIPWLNFFVVNEKKQPHGPVRLRDCLAQKEPKQ